MLHLIATWKKRWTLRRYRRAFLQMSPAQQTALVLQLITTTPELRMILLDTLITSIKSTPVQRRELRNVLKAY